MKDLMKADVRMTSIDLVELTGKLHKNIMRDIREEIESIEEIEDGLKSEPIFFFGKYTDSANRIKSCYEFGRTGAMQIALRYDAKVRFKVIKKLEELEQANISAKQDPSGSMPEWEQEGYAVERFLKNMKTPEHIIPVEMTKRVYKVGGPDLREVVGSLPCSQDIKEKEVMLEPTELGKVFEISAQAMNKKIAALGLQTKETGSWEPTDKGAGICTRHSWTKEGKSGYNYKWNKSKIEELIQEINN